MKDRSKILFGLVILLMVVGIISFSYALFTTKVEKKGALNIVAGNVSCPIQSSDLANGQITLQAKEEKEITITLTNQSLIDIHSMITYSGSSNIEVLAASSNESEIELQSLARGTTLTYTLKLKNNGTIPEIVTLNGRCGLSNKDLVLNTEDKQIEETYEPGPTCDNSNANAPDLVAGMIPVRWDKSKSSWVKANSTNSGKSWYNYCNQEWANAVTIATAEKRQTYMTAEAGEKIEEADINTMWVWIPRYEYKYTEMSQDKEIDIKFISSTVTESSDTDNYKVHPAFIFGQEQLEGFWYGKFETSSKESCTAATSSVNTACDVETNTPQIKPGVTSWRGIRVSTAFTVSQKMANNTTEYGFDGNGIDTHMSKNSEWGAVDYLSQSAYGKYHVDQQEVYINNCKNFITGIAGATASASQDSSCANTYSTEAGQKASTTGNITGVYDMSGGANEYVMGALDDGNGKPRSGYSTSQNSGFNGVLNSGGPVSNGRTLPDEKYYDLYSGNAAATACDGGVCYGHALSETAGWYSDNLYFVTSKYPWFFRGGGYYYGSAAGVFGFNTDGGVADIFHSFRLVLAPIGE